MLSDRAAGFPVFAVRGMQQDIISNTGVLNSKAMGLIDKLQVRNAAGVVLWITAELVTGARPANRR